MRPQGGLFQKSLSNSFNLLPSDPNNKSQQYHKTLPYAYGIIWWPDHITQNNFNQLMTKFDEASYTFTSHTRCNKAVEKLGRVKSTCVTKHRTNSYLGCPLGCAHRLECWHGWQPLANHAPWSLTMTVNHISRIRFSTCSITSHDHHAAMELMKPANSHQSHEWVINFNRLLGDSRHRGPCSPYKLCNHSI